MQHDPVTGRARMAAIHPHVISGPLDRRAHILKLAARLTRRRDDDDLRATLQQLPAPSLIQPQVPMPMQLVNQDDAARDDAVTRPIVSSEHLDTATRPQTLDPAVPSWHLKRSRSPGVRSTNPSACRYMISACSRDDAPIGIIADST
jgi:hypothetical protein